MEMSFAVLFMVGLIVVVILIFIVFYFLKKNRQDLRDLEAELNLPVHPHDDKRHPHHQTLED